MVLLFSLIFLFFQVCGNGPSSSSSSKAAPPANYMSDSSDGQSEKCPICLRNFTTQEVGTPEACDHSFCVDCLQEWSRVFITFK